MIEDERFERIVHETSEWKVTGDRWSKLDGRHIMLATGSIAESLRPYGVETGDGVERAWWGMSGEGDAWLWYRHDPWPLVTPPCLWMPIEATPGVYRYRCIKEHHHLVVGCGRAYVGPGAEWFIRNHLCQDIVPLPKTDERVPIGLEGVAARHAVTADAIVPLADRHGKGRRSLTDRTLAEEKIAAFLATTDEDTVALLFSQLRVRGWSTDRANGVLEKCGWRL